MKEEPVWGNEVVNEKLGTALHLFLTTDGGSLWVYYLITTKHGNPTDAC